MKKIFSFITVLLLIFIYGCQKTLKDKDYADFTHLDHWDQVKASSTDETLIYYYSPYCAISQSIEDEVTEYLVILENEGIPIFLVHEGLIFEQGIQPVEVIETPSILNYNNNAYIEKISGSIPVLEYLKARVDQ